MCRAFKVLENWQGANILYLKLDISQFTSKLYIQFNKINKVCVTHPPMKQLTCGNAGWIEERPNMDT